MNAPIKDRKLWDSLGNYCRIELHQIGQDVFELYLHDFNDATPRRYGGKLGEMINRGEIWFDRKKQAGFVESVSIYNPEAWRA